MKITLTELRQMVRNIISEMDGSVNYKLELPYQVWSGAGDEEDYGKGYDMERLVEVKELVEKELNYNIIGTMPHDNENQAEYVEGKNIKDGVFGEEEFGKNPKKTQIKYQYSIYKEKNNDVHAIIVNYHKITPFYDKNDYYKGYDEYDEEFIFYGYPN